jgi:hypothetical protein
MSISLFFVNPSNGYERGFNVPVATEDVYRRMWVPKATKLKLELILMFELGVEIARENFPKIVSELSLLNVDFQREAQNEERVQITQRIERLVEELRKVYEENPNARMYIG